MISIRVTAVMSDLTGLTDHEEQDLLANHTPDVYARRSSK